MATTSSSTTARRQRVRRFAPPGMLRTMRDSLPLVVAAGILGIFLYNPSGWSLWHAIIRVFADAAWVVEGVPAYYQPVYWGLFILFLALVWFVRLKWEIAREEMSFLYVYIGIWFGVNGLILSATYVLFGSNLLSVNWVLWQVAPLLSSTVVYGAKIPKIRLAATGARTAGGGSVDIGGHNGDGGHYDDHDHHDHHD